jgi:hypothetical protein
VLILTKTFVSKDMFFGQGGRDVNTNFIIKRRRGTPVNLKIKKNYSELHP